MLKKIVLFAVVIAFYLFFSASGYAYKTSDLKTADRYYVQKSYTYAANLYARFLQQKANNDALEDEVQLKWADSIIKGNDTRNKNKAEKMLKDLIEGKDENRWQIEAGVTLAVLYIKQDPWGKQPQIKKWLEDARGWWAGSSDIKLARQKFIETSFLLADYVTERWGWNYRDIRPIRLGKEQSIMPVPGRQNNAALKVLFEEILKVAKSKEDKAHAYYGLAMTYKQMNSGEKKYQENVVQKFEVVIDDYGRSEWADDAWYQLGLFYEGRGDFIKAVSTYRGFVKIFKSGTSKWVNDAQNRIVYITRLELNFGIANTFLPGSQIRFNVSWRNINRADFTLYKLDMTKELGLGNNGTGYSDYRSFLNVLVKQTQRYRSLPVMAQWRVTLKNDDKHIRHNKNQGLAEWRRTKDTDKIDPKLGTLPVGAYLLMVSGRGVKPAYDLVLVSDIALVSKISKGMRLFYAMDAQTGKPLVGAKIKYIYPWDEPNRRTRMRWRIGGGKTGTDGVLAMELKYNASYHESYQQHSVFAVVSGKDGKQAFVQNNYYNGGRGHNKGKWWLYAYTDRPAYRPNETVSFKGMLRRPDGGMFSNPSGMKIIARIYGPQGNQVKEGKYVLNNYGSFSDTLMLDEKAPLGEYRLEIRKIDNGAFMSSSSLFRLEEYKLPEFLVNVAPKIKEDEKYAVFKLGDKLEMEVDAQYYFGGAVADAEVEYLVYKQGYYHQYHSQKRYPWYYDEVRYSKHRGYGGYGGYGQLVTQKKIKTDKDGKAHFTIETPKEGSDLKYRIEARVVDKSRREIRSVSTVKVTKNRFFAFLEPEQNLYRPGDKAKINIKTLTANDAPVPVDGKVTIKRYLWRKPQMRGDTIIHPGGHNENELFTKFVKTNKQGEAIFTFEPQENGYYTVEFTGFDNGNAVTGHTNIYVSADSAKNIGYRFGGLQIITEKDTYSVGETARAMIVSDTPNTWVLFTKESDELYGYEVLYLEGSVKLIEIPVLESYTPNIFLHAVSGANLQLKQTSLELIIPPDDKFLNIKITSDKKVYQPRETGVFDIQITNKDGKPVVGEVSLGLVDASIYYIQSEFAPDIRKFFYGDKKQRNVPMQVSFYQRSFVNLVRSDDNKIMTKAEWEQRQKIKASQEAGSLLGRLKGAVFGTGGRKNDYYARSETAGMSARAPMEMSESLDQVGSFSDSKMQEVRKSKKRMASKDAANEDDDSGAGSAETVRNDFRSTVLWQPSIVTNKQGFARVEVTFPDSLTTWRMTARAMTQDTAVGAVTHDVKSNKDLMVRLQAPRFFTERDLVAVSGIIDNLSDKELIVSPMIKTDGLIVSGLYVDGKFVKGQLGQVVVPAKGQVRVEWAVFAAEKGLASITLSVKGGGLSDAMQKTFPVIPHGIEKFIAKSLVLKSNEPMTQSGEVVIDIPAERIKSATSLQINLSPSLAANLLDALPYLAKYPYGCVEQTMSRFLPAVIVGKTMRENGISARDVNTYINNVMEMRGDPKHPERTDKATFSAVDDMVTKGLKRLYDFQHADGGWGWWKTGDSDRFMTAYVVWGLSLSRTANIDVRSDTLGRAVTYLQTQLVEEEDQYDMLAWMLHALAEAGSSSKFEDKQRNRLWAKRDQLNPYTRALFALSEHKRGNKARSKILGQNVVNGVLEDKDNATAHWGESSVHYRWSEGGVEATAFVIKALSQIEPDSPYLDSAVKWMTLNRRGGRWKNTRDTAIAILGLADYLKATRELAPDYTYKVLVNGTVVRKGQVNASNVFSFNRIVNVPVKYLRDGENTVQVLVEGKGALYLSAHAKYFTLREGITKAGNEIFVTRKYYIQSVKETLMKGYTNDWKLLSDGDTVKSGDRIRVDIMMEAKNHYEYLITEDFKPAGLEAVALKSGAGYAIELDFDGKETSRRTPLYQEFRDQKAAFFIAKLRQGKHLIRYELRAEIPGKFHAMPNQAHAMYVPEIRANSDEMRVNVSD